MNSIRATPIDDVLDAAVARWTPKADSVDPVKQATARSTLAHLRTLRTYWAGRKVGELTQWRDKNGTIDLYVASRCAQDVANGRRATDGTTAKVSMETAHSELVRLLAEVREYAADHGLSDLPKIRMPTRPARSVAWVERRVVARLLWAVRGRVWDPATDDWKVDEDGRRVLTRKRDIGWIARLVLILVYTGSTASCASRLGWSASEDDSRSHVDLDTVMAGRSGHLHRRGPDLASKRMAGLPVKICRRLTGHLRRWRACDAGRHDQILHLTGKRRSGRGSDGAVHIGRATIDRVVERAGLTGMVDLPTLSDTAAVWALRAGSSARRGVDPHTPKPAIMRSVAFMIGVDQKSFRARYKPFALDFQERAMAALTDPADSVL